MRHIVTGNTPEWDAAMRIYIAKARARGDYETWFDMPKFNGNFIKEKKQHQQEKDVLDETNNKVIHMEVRARIYDGGCRDSTI